MTSTTDPYGYIKMEIENFRYKSREARTAADRKTLEAELWASAAAELEQALDIQIKKDKESKR